MGNEAAKKFEDIVSVAAVNFPVSWGNKADNLHRMKGYIRTAAKMGADIILFPEMALTGYGVKDGSPEMQHADAETVPGSSTLEIAELTKQYGVYVVLGMPERDPVHSNILYNSAAVIGPEGVIGAYRKIHVAVAENLWASKGNEPMLFDTPWGPVGVGICYDSYCFPELMRYYRAKGARLYLSATAIHNIEGWEEIYYTTLKSRSIENRMFLASSNIVGKDLDTFFPGASMIVGPVGNPNRLGAEFKAEPVEYKEAIVMATLDLSQSSEALTRQFGINPLTGVHDWRPDIYASLLQGLIDEGLYEKNSENRLLPTPEKPVVAAV